MLLTLVLVLRSDGGSKATGPRRHTNAAAQCPPAQAEEAAAASRRCRRRACSSLGDRADRAGAGAEVAGASGATCSSQLRPQREQESVAVAAAAHAATAASRRRPAAPERCANCMHIGRGGIEVRRAQGRHRVAAERRQRHVSAAQGEGSSRARLRRCRRRAQRRKRNVGGNQLCHNLGAASLQCSERKGAAQVDVVHYSAMEAGSAAQPTGTAARGRGAHSRFSGLLRAVRLLGGYPASTGNHQRRNWRRQRADKPSPGQGRLPRRCAYCSTAPQGSQVA